MSSPLGQRRFQLAFSGQLASTIGDYCYAVALPWLVLSHHGSPALLGTVLAVYGVPRTVLIPVGGLLNDRVGTRPLLILTAIIRAIAVGGFTLVATRPGLNIAGLIIPALILGAGEGLFLPGSLALIPALVDGEQLQAANGFFEAGMQLGSVVGPALGGVVVATAGSAPAFAIDAVSFLIAAVALSLIRGSERPSAASGVTGPGSNTAQQERTEPAPTLGLVGYLRSAGGRPVSIMLGVTLVANLAFAGCDEVALPTLAHAHFGARGFGLCMVALSVSGLVAAIIVARRTAPARPAVACILAFIVAGAAVALVPLTLTLTNALVWFAVLGACVTGGNIVIITAVQRALPPELMGRIMSLMMLCSFGTAPLSSLVTGIAVSHVGPVAPFPVAGLTLIAACLLGLASGSLRRFGIASNAAPADARAITAG